MDGYFAGFGLKYLSFDSKDIAYVIFLEILIALLANAVPGHICLDAALQILDIAERCLAHHALKHHPACQADRLSLHGFKAILNLLAVVCYFIFCYPKRILAIFLQIL